jgi:putative mRNA 3-end processing factor
MTASLVRISGSGAILLGRDVCCDGFYRDCGVRVQTHLHADHMINFETSKGCQDVVMTYATRSLLIAEYNADLPYRRNLVALQYTERRDVGTSRITLLSSGHMLGAAQVQVELDDGTRIGYSGDFEWPLDHTIKVDELVLDSTYGSEQSVLGFTQEEAEACLVRVVVEKLRRGPVHIKAPRGTVQRGVQVLSDTCVCPILASESLCREIEVYRAFGYPIGPVISVKDPIGVEAVESGRYIRLYGTGDRFPAEVPSGTTILLTAFRSNRREPTIEYSERYLSIALTGHADFEGTLAYVSATGAKRVLTDNTRGGHAIELARNIAHRLGISAEPSEADFSQEWGA